MQRKWAMLAAGAMLTTVMAGCSDKQGELGNRNIRGNSVSYDMNGNRILNTRFANDQMNEMNRVNGSRLNSNNLVGLHKNYRMEMSEALGEKISGMKGVGKAYVMLTDDNAYIAITGQDKNNHAKNGTSALNFNGSTPTPLSRSQQAYFRPHNMNSLNAHAYSGGTKTMHKGTRASSISTRNLSMKSVSGMKLHRASYGLSSSSFHNVSNGIRNMSISMSNDSFGGARNMNGLTTHYPNGMTSLNVNRGTGYDDGRMYNGTRTFGNNGQYGGMDIYRNTNAVGRDIYRGTNTLGRDIYRGTNALGNDMYRGTNALGNDMYRGTNALGNDMYRGTNTVGRDLFRGPNMMSAEGGATYLGRDVARGTENTTRDIVRGTGNVTRSLARGTVDMTRDVARGATDLTRDMARGTRELTRDIVNGPRDLTRDMARGTRDMTRDVARGTTNTARDMSLDPYRGVSRTTRDLDKGIRDLSLGTTDLYRGTTGFARDVARGTTYRDMAGTAGTVTPYAVNDTTMHIGVVPADLQAKIAAEVKRMKPSIKHVYVSSDSDFVKRMEAYMGDVSKGQPIQSYIAEFNAMVDRIFPYRSR